MMARAVPGLPFLVPLLVLVATMPTSEADANLNWPFYGCYEFDFTETIFFNNPPENTAPPGCKNCKEQKVITPKELPHDLLKGSINNLTNNTPQECMKICNSSGYSFAGVQDGTKCVCASEHPHTKSSYEDCNMPCSGDGSQICGGDWKMNLYGDDESTSPFKPPGSNGTSRVQYMGCYSNTLDRLLSGTYDNSKTNSPIQCVDSCIESGYAYAGMQYKTQCICANEEPQGAKQNESSCDYACPGDANAKCGGHWMMNVYQIAPTVNCTWSDWTWDMCSKSCGNGTQNGTRTVAQPAEHGGSECTGSTTATQSCNSHECPVDCIWTDWSWESCSKTCDNGTQNGTRTISQAAEHGGSNCTGLSSKIRDCNTEACPAAERTWQPWSNDNMAGWENPVHECPEGQYVTSMRYREQPYYGLVDMDTTCSGDSNPWGRRATNWTGGNWNTPMECSTAGFRQVTGREQNGYGIIDVRAFCSNGEVALKSSHNGHGAWNNDQTCPDGQKVVGTQARETDHVGGRGIINLRVQCALVMEIQTDGMCYVDTGSRLLKHESDLGSSNSPKKCQEYCKSEGYSYAGVQAYSQCFCGNEQPAQQSLAAQQSECNRACPGDNSAMCGGSWRMNVYRTATAV